MPRSLVGNVLVASTLIQEPLFARGVCLVVHHDEDGAIGVMLNRPFWPESNELMKLLAGGDLAPSPQDHSKSLDDAAKSSHANTPSAQAGSSLEQTGPGQVASVGPLSEQPNENGQTDGAPSHSAALSKPRRFELVVPPSGSHVAEPAGHTSHGFTSRSQRCHRCITAVRWRARLWRCITQLRSPKPKPVRGFMSRFRKRTWSSWFVGKPGHSA